MWFAEKDNKISQVNFIQIQLSSNIRNVYTKLFLDIQVPLI